MRTIEWHGRSEECPHGNVELRTWLPFPDFRLSVQCLADVELKAVRLSAMRLLRCIESGRTPACPSDISLWDGYGEALSLYGFLACTEARVRGYPCKLRPFFARRLPKGDFDLPQWVGDPAVHTAHKVELLRRRPQHYGLLWPEVDGNSVVGVAY